MNKITFCLCNLMLLSSLPSLACAAVSYTYDAQMRLNRAVYDNKGTTEYTYDATGNRLTKNTIAEENTDPNDPNDPVDPPSQIYEDGEGAETTGWDIYDNDPAGATITKVFSPERNSNVVQFQGTGTSNGYRLRSAGGAYWNDSQYKAIRWSMNYSEPYTVYVAVQTKKGFRYLTYVPTNTDNLGDDVYILYGLGSNSYNGQWQTFYRDLAYDVQHAQPDNELQAVLGFLIRGCGMIDDIATQATLPANLDSDSDGLTNLQEMTSYGTSPYRRDTDSDWIEDKEEVEFWGVNWNADADQDGIINLLDADADNDGFADGLERNQGTDPADASSVPTAILYEKGDGNITGWDIYDNDPVGATIAKVYDNERASNVVRFTGTGTGNGYRLRQPDGAYWNDTHFKSIEWSMNYSEPFTVYIAVQTKNGFRYLTYTSAENSALGDSTYVLHGLGAAVRDGNWHTITRNLEQDLKAAQPDNELQAILGFLIRGSGKVDDIKTK